jgi:septum formation inhibitor MinC
LSTGWNGRAECGHDGASWKNWNRSAGFPLLIPSRALLQALCQGESVSAEELLQRAESGEAGEPFVFRANKRLHIEIAVETTREYAHNVIAIAEGRDPQLKNEYVVVGAHLDHVGMARRASPAKMLSSTARTTMAPARLP